MKKPLAAALAVVLQDNKVLLVRRNNKPDAGLWGYPGGHIEPGETVFQTAERELFEETSVTARADKLLHHIDLIRYDETGNIQFHYLLLAVRCQYTGGSAYPADDVCEAQWFETNLVLNADLAMSKDVDTVLRIALNK